MSLSEWIILHTGGQTLYNYIFYTTATSVDLAYKEIFSAKVDKGGINLSIAFVRTVNAVAL